MILMQTIITQVFLRYSLHFFRLKGSIFCRNIRAINSLLYFSPVINSLFLTSPDPSISNPPSSLLSFVLCFFPLFLPPLAFPSSTGCGGKHEAIFISVATQSSCCHLLESPLFLQPRGSVLCTPSSVGPPSVLVRHGTHTATKQRQRAAHGSWHHHTGSIRVVLGWGTFGEHSQCRGMRVPGV